MQDIHRQEFEGANSVALYRDAQYPYFEENAPQTQAARETSEPFVH